MTAEERGMQMMLVPMGQLPPLAIRFAKRLCAEVGMCGEVLLTAWTAYAQAVEGLHCSDDLYRLRETDRQWFAAELEQPQ